MALLTEQKRVECWEQFMRENRAQLGAVTKLELRAVVDALDQYLEDNQAAINAAIPQPARAQLTVEQKAGLLMYVTIKRYL